MNQKNSDESLSNKFNNWEKTDRFQALLNCPGVMFVEIDTQGIVTLVNKKTCSVFGYTEKEMIGKNWFENFLPKRIKDEIIPISKKLLSGEIKTTEYYKNPILTKNNEEKLIYWHNTVIKDEQGIIIGHLSSGEDITEKKKTEVKLVESEYKFRLYADNSYDWEYWTDSDGNFIYVSPSCKFITGYKPEDFYNDKSLLNRIIFHKDKDLFLNHVHNKTETGYFETINFRIVDKNGEIQWIDHNCKKIIDKNGKPQGIRSSNRLITKLKEKELHLKLLSNIVENNSSSIFVTNLDGDIEYINKAFTKITGYKSEEVIGKNPRILKSGKTDEVKYTQLWNNLTNGKTWEGEFINLRKKGEEYYEKAFLSPIFNEEGEQYKYFAVKEDITRRKIAEQQLLENRQNLKIANDAKDKLFSIIAHDLKSPLIAIVGLSEILFEQYDNFDSDKHKEIIKSIATSSNNTYTLIENLLEWARTQTDGIKYSPSKQKLENIIHESILNVKDKALQKNISINFNSINSILAYADDEMIKSVMRNLISNAIKFTPKNGKIEIKTINDSKKITISIIDNGTGIEKEVLDNLFKDNIINTTRGTENEKGHGLGLLICKEFVERNGGKIWIDSTVGKGSTFSFTIPVYSKKE